LLEKEQSLESQNQELHKTNAELDRFVYSTSHDLRAPLKSMLGLIAIVKESEEPSNTDQIVRLEMLNKV
jgi:light-regulated signal transduction histidine kinase (bacteriophytochrome)